MCGSGAIVWLSVGIVLASAVAWLLTKFGGHLRAKFTIPYLCVHLVSILGQCDASLRNNLLGCVFPFKLNWAIGEVNTTHVKEISFNQLNVQYTTSNEL